MFRIAEAFIFLYFLKVCLIWKDIKLIFLMFYDDFNVMVLKIKKKLFFKQKS